MRRWILLVLTLGLLSSCDVATAALIMGSGKKSSSDDAPLVAPDPGFPDIFKAWVGFIPDAAAANMEEFSLIQANGNPSTTTWAEIGPINNSSVFDPSADPPTTINAILIQVSSSQQYDLDSIEVLDDNNIVIEHASGTTYSDQVTNPANILGPPDGVVATTTAAGSSRAFIFTLFTNPAGIPQFRINGHGNLLPPDPGDVVGVGGINESLGNERPGGMFIDATGRIYLTLSIDDVGRVSRYTQALVRDAFATISPDLASAGAHSVVVNSLGDVFTACSNGAGVIQVRKFNADFSTPGATAGFASGFNGDRVEHNSIALDTSGNLVVVGGFSSLLSGRNHWRVKIPDTVSGTPIWQSSASLDSSSTTYWHAVAAGVNDEVFIAGDLNTTLLGGTVQIYSSQFNAAGVPIWEDEFQEGNVPSDVAHAIEVDSVGNVYVAGSIGTASNARDGVLLRYPVGGGVTKRVDLVGAGDDEILDIAVDPADGAIYAVGYANVTGQGENIWVGKFTYDTVNAVLTLAWQRTHHGGFGNDRAISVGLYGTNVIVAAFETGATQTKLVLRSYAK